MASSKFTRVALFLFAGFLTPVFFTQCKTSAKTYKDVSYDAAKLKTPAGHGMERKDYPFDETGNYRKDWVKGNASGRDRSATPQSETAPVLASATPPGRSSKPSSTPRASSSYPTYAQASAARNSGSASPGRVETAAVVESEVPETGILLASASIDPRAAGVDPGPLPTPAPVSAPTPAPAKPSYHKVSSGDTLFGLAGRYNTSVAALKRVNGLSSNTIRIGQSLRLP